MADGEIVYQVKVDSSGAITEIQQAGDELGQKLNNKASNHSSAWSEVWTGAARTVGAAFVSMAQEATQAIAAFVSDSIETGKNFDSAISQVAATYGTTVDQIQAVSDKAKELGATTKFTATEAAEGLNILAMAGYDTTDSMNIISDVLALASAGNIDMESSAKYVTGALKGFASETNDATYYADLYAKGATLAATNVGEMGDAMSTAAAIADTYGQSSEETAIAVLRLAEQNEVGSAAGTALAAVMKNLYAPTDQAKKAMDQLGVAAYDNAGNARNLNDVINELDGALSNLTAEDRASLEDTIFGIQGKAGFDKMVKTTGDKLESFYTGLGQASGSAEQQASTLLDNLEGQMTLFDSALDGLKLSFYDTFSGDLQNAYATGTEWIGQLTTGMQEGGVPGALEAGMNIISSLIEQLVNSFPSIVQAGLELVLKLVEGIGNSVSNVVSSANEVIGAILNTIAENLPTLLAAGLELLNSLLQGILGNLNEITATIASVIATLLMAIINHLPEILKAGIKLIFTLISGIIQAIPDVYITILQLISEIVDKFREYDWSSLGSRIIEGMVDGLNAGWTWLVNTVQNLASSVLKAAKKMLGIASPSKEFKFIGRMTTIGMEEGIEQDVPDLERTVTTLYSSVVDDAAAAISAGTNVSAYDVGDIERNISTNLTAIASTPDQTINVPLYLDGREIARATAWYTGEQLAWLEA